MLEGGNIKLSGTITQINGKSARNILNFITDGGYFDDAKYDEMLANKEISCNLKSSKEQIIDDLNGVLSPIQRRVMKELLAHLDELNEHIRNLDNDIDRFMKQEDRDAAQAIQEIPGIGASSAQVIISVIGNDMSRFPSDRHISKWAGLCPGNNESASKRKSGKTTKGNKMLRTTLVNCAHSAVKVKTSYFSALFTRIRRHPNRDMNDML